MKSICFILAIGLFLIFPNTINADNGILNGDFEQGTINWSKTQQSHVEITETSQAKQGTKAVQITNDTNESQGAFQVIQNLTPGEYFNLKLWVKSLSNQTAKAFARVAWYESVDGSGSQASTEDTTVLKGEFDWVELSREFVVPANTKSLKLRLMIASSADTATASALFDDALLQKFTPTQTPTPSNTPVPTDTPTPTSTNTPYTNPNQNSHSYENTKPNQDPNRDPHQNSNQNPHTYHGADRRFYD